MVAALRNLAPLWAALVALIVIVFIVARLRRSRAAPAPPRSAAISAPPETDESLVDSSHIGFAPLVDVTRQQAHSDGDEAASGGGSSTRRR